MNHPTTAARDLYEAILREPLCDLVRLAYADEIEPYEPERSEFIRVQIEITKYKSRSEQKTGGLICLLSSREVDLWLQVRESYETNGMQLVIENGRMRDQHRPTHGIVRRGFVDSIAMTMQAFVGTECQLCREGHRQYGPYHERAVLSDSPLRPFDEPITPEMTFRRERCDGRGMFPGLASVICARWPVSSITITDAVVYPSGGNASFYLGGLGAFPQKYWRQLEGHNSRKGVLLALSHAAVAYARELAGLPPLKWMTNANNPLLDGPADRPVHAGNRSNDRLAGSTLSQ